MMPNPEDGNSKHLEPLLLLDTEVGAMLTVSADCVRNLHRTKQLPGVTVGRHLRWRPADVVTFVEGLDNGQT